MSAEQEPDPKQAAAPSPDSQPPRVEPPPASEARASEPPRPSEPAAASEAAAPTAPPARGFIDQIKDHKVLQWAIAYLGAALAIAQAYELVANAFGWPNVVARAVVLTLVVGFPIALTIAWYHGHRALRRVSVGELAIVSVLLLIGATAFSFALRSGDDDAEATAVVPNAASMLPLPSATLGAETPPNANAPSNASIPASPNAPASTSLAALPNKVAVLPCENQSPDPADAYFAAGLHQDIIWHLDKLRNLTPIPRITVLRYADKSLPVAAIAQELSVRALLDCTIRYAENRVRITAELVDSTGLQKLWQGDYEPSLVDIKDVFAVQADIAMNIANALSVVFTPGEQALLEKPRTVSTEAYLLFLKGYEELDYARVIELFEGAVAADADFAAPKAALAFLWASELTNTSYAAAVAPEMRAAHIARVRAYATQALELDPTIPFARSALTITAMLSWRWTEAYQRLVRAREVAPNDVSQYDIYLLSYLGRHDEAMNVVERGEQLYPNDPNNFIWRGWALGLRGRFSEAADAFSRAIAEPPGDQNLLARDWLARMEIARGSAPAALAELRLSEDIAANDRQPLFLPAWAYAYGRAGEADEARRLFAEMEEREAAGARFGAGGWAMANLAIGDLRRAAEWLEEAAQKAAAHELDEGFFNLMALRANVTNDDVLRTPELADVLARIRGD